MVARDEILDFLSSQKEYLFSKGVTKLGLFGSHANDSADIFSDIDIVIETDGKKMAKKLGNSLSALLFLDDFKKEVSKRFKTKIDLCDTTSMSLSEKNKFMQDAIYV